MVRSLSLAACLAVELLPMACVAQTPEAAPATPAAPAAPATEATATSTPAAPSHKITYSACHVDGQYIALTFDDGPHAANTPRLLDMLKQRGIKCTFFMVGQCAAEYPQIVKRIAAEGHEVANHSWTHPQLNKMSDEAVK